MPDLNLLTSEEKLEIVDGIKRAFKDVEFIGRFLDTFMLQINLKANPPSKVISYIFKETLPDYFSHIGCADDLYEVLNNEEFEKKFNSAWLAEMQKNKLRGHTISNIASVCVEAYLKNGRYFIDGDGSNDLKRVRDGSRWEIKGSRTKSFGLTINQSHVGLDSTYFIVYNGFPEHNEIHGIYILKGDERIFTPRKPGLNMRTFINDYYDTHVERLYP
ncbi:MAG TPA: hypothetical protein GX514_01700 [Thermoanaerobacterales bacterium]|uniref:hypothetical protein n=1 Tax=Tepidanaerobacter sp. GT38 TaxID=2722793 RepID=UPI0017FEDD40|nr:hypothetical protein [Tepidanaerobacter sp. GT38]MCG1011646.1 hypothetical protein [Tepidanaerobacter sp. GT38]HHY41552.1 hypothetical protein [Thermoanaerobacterales bacterium]